MQPISDELFSDIMAKLKNDDITIDEALTLMCVPKEPSWSELQLLLNKKEGDTHA